MTGLQNLGLYSMSAHSVEWCNLFIQFSHCVTTVKVRYFCFIRYLFQDCFIFLVSVSSWLSSKYKDNFAKLLICIALWWILTVSLCLAVSFRKNIPFNWGPTLGNKNISFEHGYSQGYREGFYVISFFYHPSILSNRAIKLACLYKTNRCFNLLSRAQPQSPSELPHAATIIDRREDIRSTLCLRLDLVLHHLIDSLWWK